jgi:hypothetical protein
VHKGTVQRRRRSSGGGASRGVLDPATAEPSTLARAAEQKGSGKGVATERGGG